MRSTFLSLQNHAATRRASIVVFAVATLAACDSDRAVSPTPVAQVPTTGNAAIVPGGRGDIGAGVVNGNMTYINVAGASFDFITPLGDTMHVADNSNLDSDPTWGRVTVSKVLAGTYKICPTTAPTGYAFPATFCVTTTLVSGGYAGHAWVAYVTPSLFWEPLNAYSGERILGGTYSVSSTRFGKASFSVSDNGPNDLDARPGFVAVKLGGIGSFQVCEVMPPPNYWPAITPCISATNSNGGTKFAGFFQNKEKQVIYTP
jgi:hypothetical protein